MRRLICTLMLVAAPAANAGVGTSLGLGSGNLLGLQNDLADFVRFGGYPANAGFLPSLDYRADPVVLQFHVLELIDELAEGDVYLGANFYYDLTSAGGPVAGSWKGAVQPGVSLDLFGNPLVIALMGEMRVGVEAQSAMGFGIYVVPSIGVGVGDRESALLTGGALQISAWWAGGRASGGG